MAIHVLEANEADMHRIFEICSLAFARNEPFFDAIYPLHWTESGREQGVQRFTKAKNTDPHTTFLKAVDESGKIVGMAKWLIFANSTIPDLDARDPTDYWGDETEKVYAAELIDDFLQERQHAIRRTNGNLVSLDILAIDPAHQRQGAGGKLVEWGLTKADEMDVDAVVESSVFGKGLYLKHGYVFQRDVEVQAASESFADRGSSWFAWLERPKKSSRQANGHVG